MGSTFNFTLVIKIIINDELMVNDEPYGYEHDEYGWYEHAYEYGCNE